jgi:hypothetical protein
MHAAADVRMIAPVELASARANDDRMQSGW